MDTVDTRAPASETTQSHRHCTVHVSVGSGADLGIVSGRVGRICQRMGTDRVRYAAHHLSGTGQEQETIMAQTGQQTTIQSKLPLGDDHTKIDNELLCDVEAITGKKLYFRTKHSST